MGRTEEAVAATTASQMSELLPSIRRVNKSMLIALNFPITATESY